MYGKQKNKSRFAQKALKKNGFLIRPQYGLFLYTEFYLKFLYKFPKNKL